MDSIRKILKFGNVLSLDVALGAMAGMLFFVDLLNTAIPAASYMLLAMAVWSVYTLDHLWDARSTGGKAHTNRHFFHQKNFKKIASIWVVVILAGLMMAIGTAELRVLLVPGLLIGGLMMVWMAFIRLIGRNMVSSKEFSTAVFYVVGIVLVPYLYWENEHSQSVFRIFALEYLLLAWINLLILSYLDKESDQEDGFGSILTLISPGVLKKLIIALSAVSVLGLIVQLVFLDSYYHIHSGILLVILLIHVLIFLDPNQDKEIARQKLEASFLLPFFLVFF